jgi:signal peptidase II
MMSRDLRRFLFSIVLLLLGVDLFFQHVALKGIEFRHGVFRFALFTNAGIFFQWNPEPWIVFLIMLPVVLFVLVFWIRSLWVSVSSESVAWTVIVLGATSNIVDRFLFGFVVDYFHFWIFPVFNLPDLLILGGILLLFRTQREQNISTHG